VFIHPSAIAPLVLPPKPQLPMMSPGETLALTVNLTKEQIAAGPHAHEDDPVTRDMESLLYDYYAWESFLGRVAFWGRGLAECRIATCRLRGAARGRRRNPGGGPRSFSYRTAPTPSRRVKRMGLLIAPSQKRPTIELCGAPKKKRPSDARIFVHTC
jgi:hypothetical protein